MDFEKQLQALEDIVNSISSKKLSLDETIVLYEKGMEIVSQLEKILKESNEKVEKIIEIK